MYNLKLHYGRIDTLDVVDLTSKMLTYYGDAADVPKYTNTLKDDQKKAQRVQLPIPDLTLVVISKKMILQSQAFIPKIKEWEKKCPMDKTWALWKSTFLEANEGLQSQIQACGNV